MSIIYVPVSDDSPIDSFFDRLSSLVRSFKSVTVVSTVQFKHRIKDVVSFLSDEHSVTDGGVVLGCSRSIPVSDCTVIISSGVFHAINVGVITRRPVFIIGPSGVKRLDDSLIKRFIARQQARLAVLGNARVIGVILSTKPGQRNDVVANELVKRFRSEGRDAFLFVANDVSPINLNDFPVDVWVNTACPRLVDDDFDKPVINWFDIYE